MNAHAQSMIFEAEPDWDEQGINSLITSAKLRDGPFTFIAVRTVKAESFLSALYSILPAGSHVFVDGELRGPTKTAVEVATIILTPRQIELIDLLKLKLSNKEIGRRLRLSHFTVRNMVCQLLRIYNVSSRRELARLFDMPTGPKENPASLTPRAGCNPH